MTMTNFPVKDEEIRALRVKVLRALSAAQYPAQAIGAVTGNNGITVADVKSLVEPYGWPDAREMGRHAFELEGKNPPAPTVAPETAARNGGTPAPSSAQPIRPANMLEALIETGLKSKRHRTRKIAERIREQIDDLRHAVVSEREEAEAARAEAARKARLQAEVETLERQLRAKRQELNPARKSTADAAKGTPTEMRTWARQQGLNVPTAGRLPRVVVEAYREAHPESAG